ncbi:MAG: hypothetical protein II797_04735, partial [Clostridia bacterium]|nr:hypothetical protein [Clostridia bacterium]
SVCPKINAVGRMNSAAYAVELLLAEDYDKAFRLAELLSEYNRERQNQESEIVNYIKQNQEDLPLADESVIVLSDDHWHHGIIGIVASRITEQYQKPSIMVSFEPIGENAKPDGEFIPSDEDVGKGSCRSVPGISLIEALGYCKDLLIQFGGHDMAAGLSLKRKNLDAFREKINEYVQLAVGKNDSKPVLNVDVELGFHQLTLSLARELLKLEPFGTGNETPVFCLMKAKVISVSELTGKNTTKHIKLILGSLKGPQTIEAMLFRISKPELDFCSGDIVDIAFTLDINSYHGVDTPQLIIRDIRISDSLNSERVESGKRFHVFYYDVRTPFFADEEEVPTREEFAFVYKALKALLPENHKSFETTILKLESILRDSGCYISRFKLYTILAVFDETRLIANRAWDVADDCETSFEFCETEGKTDLYASDTMKRLIALTH